MNKANHQMDSVYFPGQKLAGPHQVGHKFGSPDAGHHKRALASNQTHSVSLRCACKNFCRKRHYIKKKIWKDILTIVAWLMEAIAFLRWPASGDHNLVGHIWEINSQLISPPKKENLQWSPWNEHVWSTWWPELPFSWMATKYFIKSKQKEKK